MVPRARASLQPRKSARAERGIVDDPVRSRRQRRIRADGCREGPKSRQRESVSGALPANRRAAQHLYLVVSGRLLPRISEPRFFWGGGVGRNHGRHTWRVGPLESTQPPGSIKRLVARNPAARRDQPGLSSSLQSRERQQAGGIVDD